MAITTFSVRMDSEVKNQLDVFCANTGMNTTTAINMFARAVIRERRLPFEVTDSDPFYSESNLAHLRRVKEDAEAGRNMSVHELIDGLGGL
ncbi:MAG: type II toxin-antitoxin system RelB/DinJ family antitoxin [Synergistaceae bacterium]|jgi:DNA-damage-inducible protein J|nr:type II toxin-antitoxin system RelB/DinJ family antitoxin [Synergistaceae bacterium]